MLRATLPVTFWDCTLPEERSPNYPRNPRVPAESFFPSISLMKSRSVISELGIKSGWFIIWSLSFRSADLSGTCSSSPPYLKIGWTSSALNDGKSAWLWFIIGGVLFMRPVGSAYVIPEFCCTTFIYEFVYVSYYNMISLSRNFLSVSFLFIRSLDFLAQTITI